MRILVATELLEERKLIGEALARRSDVEKVVFAEAGVDAYIMLRNEPLDVMIASATLRRIDGIVLVRTISVAPYARHLRTVLIVGGEPSEVMRDVIGARPSALLIRPYDADQLLRRLDTAATAVSAAAG